MILVVFHGVNCLVKCGKWSSTPRANGGEHCVSIMCRIYVRIVILIPNIFCSYCSTMCSNVDSTISKHTHTWSSWWHFPRFQNMATCMSPVSFSYTYTSPIRSTSIHFRCLNIPFRTPFIKIKYNNSTIEFKEVHEKRLLSSGQYSCSKFVSVGQLKRGGNACVFLLPIVIPCGAYSSMCWR